MTEGKETKENETAALESVLESQGYNCISRGILLEHLPNAIERTRRVRSSGTSKMVVLPSDESEIREDGEVRYSIYSKTDW